MSFAGLVRALRAVKEEGGDLESVPAMFWTRDTWGPDFFLELARFHWSAICFMPKEEITEEIAREAVSQSAYSLQYIPINLRTRDLCKEATDRGMSALNAVPIEFSEEILEEWISGYPDASDWNSIPSHFRTDEFTLRAIESNPLIIEKIPTKHHTPAMCDAFLRGGDGAHYLEDVKVEARSRTLCIACLKEGRGPLDAVPRLLWGPDIVEADRIGKLLDNRAGNFNSTD